MTRTKPPKKRLHHYVYLTTNLVNGMQYVGDRTRRTLPDDDYLGSGKYIGAAVKKYGRQNFTKEILEFFPTRREAHLAEERYIAQYNTLMPNGYNISPTGGLGSPGCHSEETIKKIRKKRTEFYNDEENRKRLSIKMTEVQSRPEVKAKIKVSRSTSQFKERISKSLTKVQNRPDVKAKKSESLKKYYQNDENRKRQGERSKKMWQDPKYRAKFSGDNHPMKNPEVAAKNAASQRANFRHALMVRMGQI